MKGIRSLRAAALVGAVVMSWLPPASEPVFAQTGVSTAADARATLEPACAASETDCLAAVESVLMQLPGLAPEALASIGGVIAEVAAANPGIADEIAALVRATALSASLPYLLTAFLHAGLIPGGEDNRQDDRQDSRSASPA